MLRRRFPSLAATHNFGFMAGLIARVKAVRRCGLRLASQLRLGEGSTLGIRRSTFALSAGMDFDYPNDSLYSSQQRALFLKTKPQTLKIVGSSSAIRIFAIRNILIAILSDGSSLSRRRAQLSGRCGGGSGSTDVAKCFDWTRPS